ncbi:single-stranded DNA-binding protein [Agrobacterium sp. OT33]|uniref:single-stranded DNA-binding protein n=1 Tax=Agrobacterium sp. OT33 TaxID=2815338 RepID=UPI001A8C701B|nr:single-stranded DNA-binding protein [Agrobacterium sp. OT33]MBO0125103.1 single-stranded DNA-binding protein [Agrobacterium sp. OT33]
MMHAAAYGRLGQDQKMISTQSGKPMSVASIAVTIDDHDAPPQWIGIVAFGNAAEALSRHQKGDMLSVSGRVQRSRWTTDSGEKREQLQIVADSVISSRTVRPTGGRRRPPDHQRKMSHHPDLNNDLPLDKPF